MDTKLLLELFKITIWAIKFTNEILWILLDIVGYLIIDSAVKCVITGKCQQWKISVD